MYCQNDAMFYPPFWIYEQKWFFLVNKFMPPDLDDRNDQITLSCSKIQYNGKKIDIFVAFLYFCHHIENMAESSVK